MQTARADREIGVPRERHRAGPSASLGTSKMPALANAKLPITFSNNLQNRLTIPLFRSYFRKFRARNPPGILHRKQRGHP